MTIRKGKEKLKRPCKICEKYFTPTGKGQKMCEDCKPKTNWSKFLKLQKRVNKKNGM